MKNRARMARLVLRESKRIWIYFDEDKWSQICANVGIRRYDYHNKLVDILKFMTRKH